MKPLKLVIEGIKSFSNRVEIDFDEVSKGGLFGIFGNTGSGKSAILDSIIIALYGDLSGSKMSEIINARKKSAFVSLEFEICQKSVRKRYLVERTFKLKKDGTYGSADASLYETSSGQAIITAHQVSPVSKEIEKIIGLGQGEFTKCIILPQGEFSQFVKTTKAERTKIIEKLFSLERFGERFNAKLKSALDELKGSINSKNEALSHIPQVTKKDVDDAFKSKEEFNSSFKIESEKLSKIEEYISENTSFYALYDQLEKHKDEYEKLKGSKPKIDERIKLVGLFERAVKVVDIGKKSDDTKTQLKDLLDNYNNLKVEFEKVEAQKVSVEKEYERLPSLTAERSAIQFRKEQLDKVYADYLKSVSLRSQIGGRRKKIDDLNKTIEIFTSDINAISGEIGEFNQKRAQLEKALNSTDLFSFAKDKALYGEYLEQIGYYKSHIDKLQNFDDQTPLYTFVLGESKNKLCEYEDRLSKISFSDLDSVDNAIISYQKLQADLKEIERQISLKTAEITGLQARLNSVALQVKDEETLLDVDEADLNIISKKLYKIVENIENFEKEYEIVKNEEKVLESKIKNLSEDYAKANKEFFERREEIAKIDTLIKTLQSLLLSQTKELNELLCEDVPDLQKARQIKASAIDGETLKQEIEAFNKSYIYHQSFIEDTEDKLKKAKFSIDEYGEKLQKRQEIQKSVQELNKNLIEIEKTIENLSQNFENRCIIEKDILNLTARASVFERLEKAVERRAFSEYIAYEFLNDIANQARKTLLELTNGKYDVVYKDSVESGKIGFYILDNGNGGIERAVSTLSGGETFLVSLSLALALSASIYAGSDRPMEFFFLDEGFGTLDAELVDTVLDSLEKLRNKNFSIGLISHLSEMKSRIDRKILVTPDDGVSGSSVKVII